MLDIKKAHNKAMLWKPKATLLRRYTFGSTNRGVIHRYGMKLIVFSLLLFASSVYAAPNCEKYSPFNFYPHSGNQSYGFSLKKSEVIRTAKWDGKSDPKMKLSEAVSLSNAAVVSKKLDFTVKLESVSFTQFGCSASKYFYYDIAYQTFDIKGRMMGSYHIIIYQNGKVNMPIPVETPVLGR